MRFLGFLLDWGNHHRALVELWPVLKIEGREHVLANINSTLGEPWQIRDQLFTGRNVAEVTNLFVIRATL